MHAHSVLVHIRTYTCTCTITVLHNNSSLPVSPECLIKVNGLEYTDSCRCLLVQTLVHVVSMTFGAVLKEYLSLLTHTRSREESLQLLTTTVTGGKGRQEEGGGDRGKEKEITLHIIAQYIIHTCKKVKALWMYMYMYMYIYVLALVAGTNMYLQVHVINTWPAGSANGVHTSSDHLCNELNWAIRLELNAIKRGAPSI